MYRQSEKKLVKQQYLLHLPSQCGELRPTNGIPVNFNRVRVLASLLQGRRSTEGNQTLHMFDRLLDWYTIYILSRSLAR